MTPTDIALARRAIACKEWMPVAGMLSLPDKRGRWFRIIDQSAGAPPSYLRSLQVGGPVLRQLAPAPESLLPDFLDPATLGGLLALVREAWGEPLLHAVPVGDGLWMVPKRGSLGIPVPISGSRYSSSEAEALVAALEAANDR